MIEKLLKEVHSLIDLLKKRISIIRSDNNTVIFLICLSVSTLFWFLKALNDNYSTEVEFPIEFTNIPDTYTLSGNLPDKLIATVEDDGFTIMRYKFAFAFTSFKFDVSKSFATGELDDDKGTIIISQADLKVGVADELINQTNLVSVYPENVTIAYSKLKEKKVPVKVLADIEVAQQHIVNGQVTTIPDSIVIIGADAVLKNVREVSTVPIAAENLKDTLRRNIALQSIVDVRFSEKKVALLVPVEAYTEKIVEVPIVGHNFPDSLQLRTFPGMVTISAICGLSQYNQLKPNDFICSVDYNDIKENSNGSVTPKITSRNSLAQRVKLRINVVDYLIEKK